ncbi:MAG: hypothetical protein V5A64_00710 [Candidatus Thermoplasmatota archaeon]
MKDKSSLGNFLEDERAVSEEFTSLPALSVVMIGFTVFILLIANTYTNYNNNIENMDKYQQANHLLNKLTNPDCFFIKNGETINLPLLKTSDTELNQLKKQYQSQGVDFIIKVSYEDKIETFPATEDISNLETGNRVAVSKPSAVYINPAYTKPGKITIITWRR